MKRPQILTLPMRKILALLLVITTICASCFEMNLAIWAEEETGATADGTETSGTPSTEGESGETSESGSETESESESESESETETEPVIDIEEMIKDFPDDYKVKLRELHELHPNWVFEAYYPTVSWSELVNIEYINNISANLIATSNMQVGGVDGDSVWYPAPTSWKSLDVAGAFNWSQNQWVVFNGSNWIKCSKEALTYVMDPRNWLTENNIFMFEKTSFTDNMSDTTLYKTLVKMLDNSFMDCDWARIVNNAGESIDYATAILEAGKTYGVSPIHLCAIILVEQGRGTRSEDIYKPSGVHAVGTVTEDGKNFTLATGSEETIYYNYFNIQATGASVQSVINTGGVYAKSHGWTTPYKAIMGGAQFLSSGYINVGQDTTYTQKFNIVTGKYWHQYWQNVLAPVTLGYTSKKNYANTGLMDLPFTFKIPVYSDAIFRNSANPMPSREKGTANPNYKLSGIKATGSTLINVDKDLSLTPSFGTDKTEYNIIVGFEVDKINISATAYATTSQITGAGKHNLLVGDNRFEIKCTSAYGLSRTYVVNVFRAEGSTYLSALGTNAGQFSRPFDKEIAEYEMKVDNDVDSITFIYDLESPLASVELRYEEWILPEEPTEEETETESESVSEEATEPTSETETESETEAETETETAEVEADEEAEKVNRVVKLSGGNTGELPLYEGNNYFYFDVYPVENDRSIVRTYKVNVIRYTAVVYEADSLQMGEEYINGFEIGENINDVLSRFNVEYGMIKVLAKDGTTEKTSSEVIATGDFVVVYDMNGFEINRTQVIVYGDVNCDGKVDLFDFAYIKVYYLKNRGLEEVGILAANTYGNEPGFDLFDIAALKSYILKGKNIVQKKGSEE